MNRVPGSTQSIQQALFIEANKWRVLVESMHSLYIVLYSLDPTHWDPLSLSSELLIGHYSERAILIGPYASDPTHQAPLIKPHSSTPVATAVLRATRCSISTLLTRGWQIAMTLRRLSISCQSYLSSQMELNSLNRLLWAVHSASFSLFLALTTLFNFIWFIRCSRCSLSVFSFGVLFWCFNSVFSQCSFSVLSRYSLLLLSFNILFRCSLSTFSRCSPPRSFSQSRSPSLLQFIATL